MGISPGRTDDEAFVVFRVGKLDISFALDVATLRAQCEDILELTAQSGPTRPQ